MQTSVAHTSLAPISEDRSPAAAGAASSFKDPRRSLRGVRTSAPDFDLQQAAASRRHTLQLNLPADRRTSWRRPSSIRSSEGGGKAAAARQAVRLENTYRTGPTQPFQPEAAQSLLAERLAASLQNYRYQPQSAPQTAVTLAQEIKNKMKQHLVAAVRRYKVVVLVTITEPEVASGQSAARALWSAETGDACVTAEFRNHLVAVSASVFVFYYE